jgi:phosphatidylinositol glycan class A protein
MEWVLYLCIEAVVEALTKAIDFVQSGRHDPHIAHAKVSGMYDWGRIASRTEKVYRNVMATPQRELWNRITRCGGSELCTR